MCLNSVTLSLYLSITLVRARCYHNECICLMCSVGEVQEVDSRLTCYNLSCCYARKRWRVLFLCLICYVYIHRSLMSTGQESREQLFWWGSFLVAYIHSPNHHRERHDLHLQVTVCFCDQVAYKHSANQKLWCPHCPPPHHHYPDIWHLIKITRISTHRCTCLSCIACTFTCITCITWLIHVLFAFN